MALTKEVVGEGVMVAGSLKTQYTCFCHYSSRNYAIPENIRFFEWCFFSTLRKMRATREHERATKYVKGMISSERRDIPFPDMVHFSLIFQRGNGPYLCLCCDIFVEAVVLRLWSRDVYPFTPEATAPSIK